MAGLFSTSQPSIASPRARKAKPDVYLRYSSSVQGRPKAIGWGCCRLAPNVIWYAGFRSVTTTRYVGGGGGGGGSSSGGGKGFLASSSSAPADTGSTRSTTRYYVDIIYSLCEGPVAGVGVRWNGKNVGPPKELVLVRGTYDQQPWSYLNYYGQALAYRGEAYLCAAGLGLGTSSSLPNYSIEVVFAINIAGGDCNPADAILDLLTNPGYGVPNFDASLIGDLSAYRAYCAATGLLISYAVTEQTPANAILQDLAAATNSEFRWSAGKLSLVPYADANETGNGAAFIAPTAPVYDLTRDDFLPNQGSLGAASAGGASAIVVARQARADMVNHVRLEYLDRSQQYNPATVEAWDEASIIAYGDRPSDLKQAHMFASNAAASHAAAMQLARAQIATTYQFTLGRKFVLLDPMDIVTLTEPALGFVRQPVRITEIQENADGSLTCTADEYHGTVTAPVYVRQPSLGTQVDFNVDPGALNPPLIFEPPYLLAGGLAVWCAISGRDHAAFGGYNVWVSSDGAEYSEIGTIEGGARMGVATTPLPAVAPAISGQTIDTVNPLGVDLTESGGQLVSASQNDMLAGNTALLIDGEVVAYQAATLTDTSKYTLGPLLRGAFDTNIVAHLAGAPLVRLDDGLFKYPYAPDRIGQTIYLKFQAFNIYGGALEDLSQVGSVPYTITGSPLAAALAVPQNVRTSFTAGFQELTWDEIEDFRTGIRYKVYSGDTFQVAQEVADVAHPPFRVPGSGKYFVTAYCQPILGLTVTSLPAKPLTIAGNMIVVNAVKVWDQGPKAWPGALQNLVVKGNAPTQLLALTEGAMAGTYTVPAADVIDLGYVGVLSLTCAFKAVAAPIGQDILGLQDFLGQADILGAAGSKYVEAFVEVQIGNPGSSDQFVAPDVFQEPNVFDAAIVWNDWQKFQPGDYPGRYANFRITIVTTSPQVTGYLLAFGMTASVPTRIDHYQNLTVPAAGLPIIFQPDGSTSPAPFTGGPANAALPYVNVTAANLQVGDLLQVTGLAADRVTIQITNGGAGVARAGINVDVQGY